MAKITWTDKIDVHTPAGNANERVDASTMNEIKASVNEAYDELASKANKSDTYSKIELNSIVDSRVDSRVDDRTYTKTEVDAKVDTKADIADTYTKTEVDTKADTKADIIDTYTKTEVDTKVDSKADIIDTYTKTEVDTKLADINEIAVGDIIYSVVSTKVGYLLCNGQTVLKTEYPELAALFPGTETEITLPELTPGTGVHAHIKSS